jgi:hypothetical protein
MAFVTIYTVGRLNHPYDHPASREFFEVGYEEMRQASKTGQLIEEFSPYGVPIPEEAAKGKVLLLLHYKYGRAFKAYIVLPTQASIASDER